VIAATTSPFTESPSTEALPAPHAAMGDFEAVFDDGRATEDDLKPAAVLHDTVSTFERAALPEEPEAIALEREWEPESVAAATGEGGPVDATNFVAEAGAEDSAEDPVDVDNEDEFLWAPEPVVYDEAATASDEAFEAATAEHGETAIVEALTAPAVQLVLGSFGHDRTDEPAVEEAEVVEAVASVEPDVEEPRGKRSPGGSSLLLKRPSPLRLSPPSSRSWKSPWLTRRSGGSSLLLKSPSPLRLWPRLSRTWTSPRHKNSPVGAACC